MLKFESVVPVNKWFTILQSEQASAHTSHLLEILSSSIALDKDQPLGLY